jgi:uridine kinase
LIAPVLDLTPVARAIRERRARVPSARSLLCAITGIDGSGKGYVSARLSAALTAAGLGVAKIGIDGWLNLPAVRFGGPDPGRHFYEHAIRFDALFRDLVLPLRERRAHTLTMAFVEETATTSRPHTYEFSNVDVIILEGVFLLKRAQRTMLDWSCWIDCTFDTALERAIRRQQEGLGPEATRSTYETIYFPAQRLHLALDDPRAAADWILPNDARLSES